VERENDVRPIRDKQVTGDTDARSLQRLHFFDQRRRIDHDPIADNRLDSRPKDTAGDQFQHVLGVADEDRVPRIVAALVAGHYIETVGKQVDNLALTLIAPLCAQNNDVVHLAGSSYLINSPSVVILTLRSKRSMMEASLRKEVVQSNL
jgi:hypothetical protein